MALGRGAGGGGGNLLELRPGPGSDRCIKDAGNLVPRVYEEERP